MNYETFSPLVLFNRWRKLRPNGNVGLIGDAILPQNATKLTKSAVRNLAHCRAWRHLMSQRKPQYRCKEICNGGGAQKLERCPYQTVKKCDDMCNYLNTIGLLALDRETDGRTDKRTDLA